MYKSQESGSYTVAFHVTVSGRVQGVGYRVWAQLTARRLGVFGWVKNDWNGNVEIHVEGKAATVNEFLEALKAGPSMSRVEKVNAKKATLEGYSGFEVEF